GVYDGAAHGASGSAKGVQNENLSTLLTLGASFTNVPGGTAHWTFAGNTNYSSTVGDANISITAANSTTTLTSSLNPSTLGYSVTFTATVSGSGGTPSGTVVFNAGSPSVVPAALISGQAAFSTSLLAAGPHSITAVYSGDANFLSSTSSALSQTVQQPPAITSANTAAFALDTS